ncbi:MAG: Cof-type HAD-IIB family hydrolase [Lachnotalea sp.]
MKKIIFLDIDGTLCDIHGTVPQSAIMAVQTARKNGHKVYLCTGRSKGEIYEKIFDIGFDGLIGAAGAYVESDNEVLYHKSIDDNTIHSLVEYLQENKIVFVLETNHGVFMQNNDIKILEELFKAIKGESRNESEENMGILKSIGNVSQASEVNKVLFFCSSKSIQEIQDQFKENLLVMPSSIIDFGGISGEISDKNINKSTGIQIVLEHLGITREAVIAMGDGPNDVEMLEFANIGIAMGNALDQLKQHADEVTDSVSENGIYNSFKKHELI